ncbi:PrsW family glutamic-type intramembrane protease [Streptomyces sp. RG80]|uniref:PrsW family glutamic-type intramembrane protease n=1 Tax=Streptomyces sp. RG80 TaxID=3157340 RepID=UPI00338DEE68
MTLVMAVAALWGVLQLFTISWPTRSVRLSTVLLAMAVGAYGSGVATALTQLTYTRVYAEQSDQSLVTVVNTTGYTVAPWVEELLKASPLLLAGLSLKVRRQWSLTDFVMVGAALGAGFGLLEAVLRFGLDADRAIVRDGGWIIPDSLNAPYVPGLGQVLTSWLPAPFSQLDLGGPAVTETFTHLVWTALAGFGVGLFWRAHGWVRLLSAPPITAAAAHHTLNNYAVEEHSAWAEQWLDSLDGVAWSAPLVCLAIAMAVDLRQLHHGKRTAPDILLTSEQADGDSLGALLRYAAWRPPWSLLLVLRYVRLRRSLLYAAASAPPEATEELRRVVAGITARMDMSDNQRAWQTLNIRAWLKTVRRSRRSRDRWLLMIPCVLMIPALLFLVVGSFTSTAGLQEFFSTGAGPRILMGFGTAALAWIAYQLTTLLRTWRPTSDQPMAEVLAAHRFRLGTALGAATTGVLLLWRGLGDAGPDGRAVRTLHLLDALNSFLVYLGFALLLLSLLALFPPGGLALAGGGAVGALTAEAALNAGLLGTAGLVLMGLGASNGGGDSGGSGPSASGGGTPGAASGKGPWQAGDKIEGPARGKQLRFPNSRHTVSGSGSGMVRERNSVIMRGHEREVAQDIEGIAAGRAEWINKLSRYKINGRTYGIEDNGTVFPGSGPNIVNLNRIEYGALKEIVRARGNLSAAPRLTRDPKFIENPEAVEKALKIYNGIIP